MLDCKTSPPLFLLWVFRECRSAQLRGDSIWVGARKEAGGVVNDVLRVVIDGSKTDIPGIAISGGANAARDGAVAGIAAGVAVGVVGGSNNCGCN